MAKVKNTARRIEVERVKLVTGIDLPLEDMFMHTGDVVELDDKDAEKLCRSIGGMEWVGKKPVPESKKPRRRGRPRKNRT